MWTLRCSGFQQKVGYIEGRREERVVVKRISKCKDGEQHQEEEKE